jgi:hypothetical protein
MKKFEILTSRRAGILRGEVRDEEQSSGKGVMQFVRHEVDGESVMKWEK